TAMSSRAVTKSVALRACLLIWSAVVCHCSHAPRAASTALSMTGGPAEEGPRAARIPNKTTATTSAPAPAQTGPPTVGRVLVPGGAHGACAVNGWPHAEQNGLAPTTGAPQ